MRNFYREFGLNADFTSSELKSAYKARLRQCHPDVAGDSPESTILTAELNRGYEIMSDPAKRREYDAAFPEYRQGAPVRQEGWAVGGAGERRNVSNNRSGGVWDPVTRRVVFPNGTPGDIPNGQYRQWDSAGTASSGSGRQAAKPPGTSGNHPPGARSKRRAPGTWDPVARRMSVPSRPPIDIPDPLKVQLRTENMERSFRTIDQLKRWSLGLAMAGGALMFIVVLMQGDGGHLMERLGASFGRRSPESHPEYWLPLLNAWFAVHIKLGLPLFSWRKHFFRFWWSALDELRPPGKADFAFSACAGGFITLWLILKIFGSLFG